MYFKKSPLLSILFVISLMTMTQVSNGQLKMFYTGNSTIITPNQKKGVNLTVTNTIQSTTQIASSITYRPLRQLNITGSIVKNEVTFDGGLGIGTSYKIDSVNRNGGWYFDAYAGMHFAKSDLFKLDVFSNSYFGQIGAHMRYRALTLSFISKLYITDITKLAVENLESNQHIIDELNSNDPYIYPETKTRISLNNRGITAFAQISKLYFKDSFAIDDRIRLSLGVSINIQDSLSAWREEKAKL